MSSSTTLLRGVRGRRALATASVALLALAVNAAPSWAASTPAPAWNVAPTSQPTAFAAGSTFASSNDSYVITVTNTGGASATTPGGGGSAITVTDMLPAGISADHAGASGIDNSGNTINCSSAGQTVTCTDEEDVAAIRTDQQIQITIPVDVASSAASGAVNQVSVSGGGGATQTASDPTTISASPASFGLTGFTAQSLNADGTLDTQAGSTPNQVVTGVSFSTVQGPEDNTVPAGNLRDTTLNLPPGLIGNPTTVPTCSQAAIDVTGLRGGVCPVDAQVGIADVEVLGPAGPELIQAPIYNLAAPTGMPAQFGFTVLTSVIDIDFSVRTGGDYGLTATIQGTNAGAPLYSATILVWGDPSSSTHDDARYLALAGSPGSNPDDPGTSQPIPSTLTPASLLTNPTSCTGPVSTSINVDDWQDPTTELTAPAAISPATTGCAAEPFAPTTSVQPDTTVADSPSALDVDIQVPQSSDPTALAEANLQDVTVTLPAGIAVSPSGANGLQACTEAEIGLSNDDAPACPSASALGTVEIDTPLLATPLEGSVYLAQQTANPFGSLLALYVTAQADGVLVKLAGQVSANPTTGQLSTTFDDNPQLPFSALKLDFFGGPNAPLSTPSACGTYTTTSSLSPWSGMAAAAASTSFTINSGCASGFAPTFAAGTTSTRAGAYSPFVLSFARADTDQYLTGLDVTLPPGALAKISGVTECTAAELASISSAPGTGAAQAAHPSCPSASQVGTAQVSAGPGTDPYTLGGHVYLTGPYKGGPFGLAVVVPAVAGPLDLGTVVVRQALDINPTTAQVTVRSDPFPTILDGIPLQLRSVTADLNRSHFTVNPTSCATMAVTGTLGSASGTSAAVSSRFHVAHCSSLKFSPKLRFTLSGKHQTSVGRHPTLTTELTQRSGEANLKSVKVTLPLSLALDPNNSQHVCSVAAAAKIACPKRTIVGKAVAHTRILPVPLRGLVYLVQGERKGPHGVIIRTLPTLLVPLRGDHVSINLTGKTSVNSHEELVTTFPAVPDAGIRSFQLVISGGRRGILVVTGSHSLCSGRQIGTVAATGHNGKRHGGSVTLATPACPASATHHRTKKHKQ